jgi:hypothetical protein
LLPSFTGTAVKFTVCPAQIVWVGVVILTAGVTLGLTVIDTGFALTVAGVTQFALEVRITDTASPLLSVLLVNTGEFVPTGFPLSIHW